MPRIAYRQINFLGPTRRTIQRANDIIDEYAAQGFDLTLRQLYYQFVARGLLPNTQREYSRLGGIVNDARLAGLIDWERITDRTRSLRRLQHWDNPGEIVSDASLWYNRDLWASQDVRPEVWIEKDALAGVFESVCTNNDVPYFSCRGYTSQSEMWSAGQRLLGYLRDGKRVVIFHFGDHDPSGRDMTRDVEERLTLFLRHHRAEDMDLDLDDPDDADCVEGEIRDLFEVRRMALNYAQVEQFDPPPNPVKQTDSRWQKYVDETGLDESWELDALDPGTLVGLVETGIESIRHASRWNRAEAEERRGREQLRLVASRWDSLMEDWGSSCAKRKKRRKDK